MSPRENGTSLPSVQPGQRELLKRWGTTIVASFGPASATVIERLSTPGVTPMSAVAHVGQAQQDVRQNNCETKNEAGQAITYNLRNRSTGRLIGTFADEDVALAISSSGKANGPVTERLAKAGGSLYDFHRAWTFWVRAAVRRCAMGIISLLSGRQPRRPRPTQLTQAIEALGAANTGAASQRQLKAHPELLSDAADDLLGHMIDDTRRQQDPAMLAVLVLRRDLLRRCRAEGVEATVGVLPEQPPGGVSSRVWQTIHDLSLTSSDLDAHRMVEQHPELLSAEADEGLRQFMLIAREEQDSQLVAVLAMRRDLLRCCRAEREEAAFGSHPVRSGAPASALATGLVPRAA